VDGPFTEAKKLVAGYTLIQMKSREEALEWARRFPNPMLPGQDGEIEVRQLHELEDLAGRGSGSKPDRPLAYVPVMCLVLFAIETHPHYSLIIAANRDEFYDRPTAPAVFWPGAPMVLGGRDLRSGGSWLGIDRKGRFAAVTNFRQGVRETPAPRSRGCLVSDFLVGSTSAAEYMERIRRDAGWYNGFNLIVGDASGCCYYSNREDRARGLAPGIYGLSNHLLDTPWPKVTTTKSAFDTLLRDSGSQLIDDMFTILSDRTRPPENLLPSTGVSPDWERLLSSAFIVSDNYGTRSSTVVLFGRDRKILFIERSFGPGGTPGSEKRFEIRSEPRVVSHGI
jgi:uncharacterized protein with NRDE domain